MTSNLRGSEQYVAPVIEFMGCCDSNKTFPWIVLTDLTARNISVWWHSLLAFGYPEPPVYR